MKVSERLRSLAQNDYMIDGRYLEDGKFLCRLADVLEDLEVLEPASHQADEEGAA